MAIVDSTVTPKTVKIRRCSLRSSFGNIALMAIAAEAPQIATAPAVSKPNRQPWPKNRATQSPNKIVARTPSTTSPINCGPNPVIRSALIRTPKSATPTRNNVLPVKLIPATVLPSSPRKLTAMPSKSASSITGVL